MKPLLAITIGDFNGIGPEVTLKSVASRSVRSICTPLLVGSIDVYEHYARKLRLRLTLRETADAGRVRRNGIIPVMPLHPFQRPVITPGAISEEAGRYAGEALSCAAALCVRKKVDGMVTAPVSKEAMAAAGYRFPGQTDMLGALTRTPEVTMMLVADQLRVGLATVHIPVARVSRAVTRAHILRKLLVIDRSLRRDFGLRAPRIAVLGLNPHAGEHGLIGREERKVISPAMASARARHVVADGPYPADGFFGSGEYRRYDAILAMYHDQGLIPLKMKGFAIGVNYSAGLPIVRTSPDHGTAFAIAGRGIADPSSMIEAIRLAVSIIHHRRRNRRAGRA